LGIIYFYILFTFNKHFFVLSPLFCGSALSKGMSRPEAANVGLLDNFAIEQLAIIESGEKLGLFGIGNLLIRPLSKKGKGQKCIFFKNSWQWGHAIENNKS
jgi:hypothetical protein